MENTLEGKGDRESGICDTTVNRVGDGDGLHYIPGSHVYDWLGRDVSIWVSEKLRVADIDPGAVRHARTEFPQTNDRKNTFYKMLY